MSHFSSHSYLLLYLKHWQKNPLAAWIMSIKQKRVVSQQLSHVSSPMKTSGRTLTHRLHENQNHTILGQAKNVFLLQLSFYLLTPYLIPRFSTKLFLCAFAPFYAMGVLFSDIVLEVLKLMLSMNPPSPGRNEVVQPSSFKCTEELWPVEENRNINDLGEMGLSPCSGSIWTALQKEAIFQAWYYSKSYK